MNNTITFDTHFHAKNLKKAGFNDDQIEAQLALAQAQTDFINNNLATKNDIASVKNDIASVKKDLNILWLKMTITLGSIMLTGLGLIKLLKL